MGVAAKKEKPEAVQDMQEISITLSAVEERELFEQYRGLYKRGEFTEDDLWDFIRIFYGYEIPRRSYCKNHCAPFDFIKDAFFDKFSGAVAYASRGGGKTLDLALLHNVELVLKDGIEWVHAGATDRQGNKCYQYFREFAGLPVLKNFFKKTLMRDAETEHGSRLENIPGTYAAVSGPHPNKFSFDEIEEVNDKKIIEKAFGCPSSRKGYSAQMLLSSTRDFVGGMMDWMLKKAGRIGWDVYVWCIFDVVERCPSENKCKNCKPIVQERCFDMDNPRFDSEGYRIGRCKFTDGFYPIQDFMDKAASVDDDTWIAQFLCKTPQRTGVAFKVFSRDTHVWKHRTNFRDDLDVYVFVDFGFTAPCVFLWVQKDATDRLWVRREMRWVGYEIEEICDELLKYARNVKKGSAHYLPIKDKTIRFCADSAAPDKIKTICRKLGWSSIRVIKAEDKELDAKLTREQMKLRSDGYGGIVFDPGCVGRDEDNLGVIEEFEQLKYRKPQVGHNPKDVLEDYNDHGVDAIIYGVKGIMHRGKLSGRNIKAGGRIGMEMKI